MKRLLLQRHAKAATGRLGEDDHDRPLSASGCVDAQRMAKRLVSRGCRPSLVLCSSARRARETLDALEPKLGADATIEIEEPLYLAGRDALLERLTLLDPSHHNVMLIGHNPAISMLSQALAHAGEAGTLRRMRNGYAAGSLAELDLEIERWEDLRLGGARLIWFESPRELED